jgi:Protein of unknown function (DUF992)
MEAVMKKAFLTSVGAALLAAGSLLVAPAQAAGVQIGTLTCHVEPGFGLVLGSSKDVDCTYKAAQGFEEHYIGNITKIGVDIGYTRGGTMVWAVFAPSSDRDPGALEGRYAGATAGASVGVGLGANVLIGGFDKSIALQPLSIEGNTGLNLAAGIGALNLRSDVG